MPASHVVTKRVEFSETDMAGIVHFSNFFRYMELVEHDFFRSLGTSIAPKSDDEKIGWPRVNATCDFKKPLYFEDEFEIRLEVVKKTTRSLTYEIQFHRDYQTDTPTLIAIGRITAVCVSRLEDGTIRARPIPERLDALIQVKSPSA